MLFVRYETDILLIIHSQASGNKSSLCSSSHILILEKVRAKLDQGETFRAKRHPGETRSGRNGPGEKASGRNGPGETVRAKGTGRKGPGETVRAKWSGRKGPGEKVRAKRYPGEEVSFLRKPVLRGS